MCIYFYSCLESDRFEALGHNLKVLLTILTTTFKIKKIKKARTSYLKVVELLSREFVPREGGFKCLASFEDLFPFHAPFSKARLHKLLGGGNRISRYGDRVYGSRPFFEVVRIIECG